MAITTNTTLLGWLAAKLVRYRPIAGPTLLQFTMQLVPEEINHIFFIGGHKI